MVSHEICGVQECKPEVDIDLIISILKNNFTWSRGMSKRSGDITLLWNLALRISPPAGADLGFSEGGGRELTSYRYTH